ncbi:lipopolysaccharide biosynthesis protein [Pseudooceanicola algae]|uniref:Uncharacterized protein n=1 Tax=Pseudooceanicola algae TaxID=1537215 RepID=A0A418SD82_9RHOB|nr:lipopolysaccharide biosynthesis protein [Pseudooceanicola algae]QPM92549.1 hypothetical protein PSAL_038130 [Pseudooceanicola algae]
MASRTRQMLGTIITRFAGKSANFLVFAIMARALTVPDLGIYGFVFTTCLLFATLFDVGIRNSVANFIGKDEARAADYTRQSLLLLVVLAVLCALFTPAIYSLQKLDVPLSSLALPAMVNAVALLTIRMQQGILLGLGDIKYFNTTELAPRVVLLAGAVALLLAGAITLSSALWLLALSNLAGAVSVVIGTIPKARGGSLSDLTPAKALLKRGFLFMLGVVAMLAAKQIAFLILTQIGSEGQAGLFYGLRRLTEILTEIGLAVSVVLFSQNVRAASREEALEAATHSTRISFWFFVALSVIAAVTAPVLVPLALGPDFAGYTGLFRILLLGTLIGTIWIIIYPSMTAIDSPLVAFLIFLPNLAIGSALTWWLFHAHGLIGAGVAMAISQLLLSLSFLGVFWLRYGVSPGDFLVLRKSDLGGVGGKLRRKFARKSGKDKKGSGS